VITNTNNALEFFNNVITRFYTLNARHSLSSLVDLFMEQLVFDLSMDIKALWKCYKLGREECNCYLMGTWLMSILSC
jgi:hypothetical protein